MHTLAYTYLRQDRLVDAADLQKDALDGQRLVLGDDHLDTIRSMHILACTYIKQDRLDKAEELERYVVSVRKHTLGESCSETLWAMYILATIYLKQGRQDEARDVDRHILQNLPLDQGRHITQIKDAIPSICEDIKLRRPGTFELEVFIISSWAQAIRESVSVESISMPRRSDYQSVQAELPKNPDQTLPMQDVFRLLVKSGCPDLGDEIDPSQCPTAPYAGGRFGDVWCSELQDRTQAAIKCLRLHTTSDTSLKTIKRAARELYYWSKAKHENVLELIGIAIFRGRLAMISPWMTNGTLHNYIYNHPNANRWDLCEQVAEGLAYIHGIGMVHGDLKAVNVLVSDDGKAKLSDFGNAILSDHSLAFTGTTNIGGGTSRWMAPELLRGEDSSGNLADRSRPADVYALGMTILEVLTGQLPYVERRSEAYVTLAVVKGILPERPTQLMGDTSFGDERWEFLKECWKTEPELRPTARATTVK
ncbi:hypothetical protein FRC07_000092, partial [Ceratobasidium sp. 392]